MRRIKGFFLICLSVLVITGCNQRLTKNAQITSGVTVLLPDKFEKVDASDGQIVYNSKIGRSTFRVFVFKDIGLDTIGLDKVKDGMKFNVTRFIEPIKGKIVKREDTVIGKIVQSDFEFEHTNSTGPKFGAGRFIVKGAEFIGFIYETKAPETSSNKALRKSFFDSIQIER